MAYRTDRARFVLIDGKRFVTVYADNWEEAKENAKEIFLSILKAKEISTLAVKSKLIEVDEDFEAVRSVKFSRAV